MNYDRIYQYRFQQVSHDKKKAIWKEIAAFFFKILNQPIRILDSAGGMCEFINAVPSSEKWVIDISKTVHDFAAAEVKIVVGDSLKVELPPDYFDAVFISNFLEHLHSQEQVAHFLERTYATLRPGGKIAVIGPNFKFAYREYFDFADHTVVLSELGVEEHLYGAGFKIEKTYPRFLPLSFRGGLPVHKILVRLYLNMPFVWFLFGKQFLIIAEKPSQ